MRKVIADGSRGHSQRENEYRLRYRGRVANDADEAPFAQKTMRLPTQGRSATPWIAAAMLAMTWASETQASPDQARHLADAQHAMAARNFDSDGTAGYGGFEACCRAAAATKNRCRLRKQRPAMQDTLRNGNSTGRRHCYLSSRLQGATSNCCNVSSQEHDRAERLEQALAAARRDVETQTAMAEKASEQASRLKQAAESGTAEVQTSLQQERERSARLEQDLAAARRDVETQTALAAKASEEVLRRKQAAGAAKRSCRNRCNRSARGPRGWSRTSR